MTDIYGDQMMNCVLTLVILTFPLALRQLKTHSVQHFG